MQLILVICHYQVREGVSNCIRGVFGSSNAASPIGQNNVIDYVTIATLGNAKDFGDMTQIGHSGMSASNLHGGLR